MVLSPLSYIFIYIYKSCVSTPIQLYKPVLVLNSIKPCWCWKEGFVHIMKARRALAPKALLIPNPGLMHPAKTLLGCNAADRRRCLPVELQLFQETSIALVTVKLPLAEPSRHQRLVYTTAVMSPSTKGLE